MVQAFSFAIIMMGMFSIPRTFGSPAEDPDESTLDRTQKMVGTKINALANKIDSFFATERADDELGRSSVRIRYTYTIRERAIPDEGTRYRINLRLPHLEEKFKYEYYADQGKSEEQLESEKEARAMERRNRPKKGWLFNADAGVSVAIPPKLITRARLRNSWETGSYVHRFVEELTYITDESGLTEETTLQSDKRLTDNLLFRFINRKRWRVLKKEFVTNHGPTFPHQITDDDAFSYDLIMSNVLTGGTFFVTAYTLSVNYRRNVYKNWVYLDIIPGLDFPKEWSFRRTPFLSAQIEVLFN